MRYTGENCPYCGVTFTEQDDVVVCPECATPHHRVCWLAHGECANTEKHGTDFVWKKSSAPQPEKEAEQQADSHDNANLDIICRWVRRHLHSSSRALTQTKIYAVSSRAILRSSAAHQAQATSKSSAKSFRGTGRLFFSHRSGFSTARCMRQAEFFSLFIWRST